MNKDFFSEKCVMTGFFLTLAAVLVATYGVSGVAVGHMIDQEQGAVPGGIAGGLVGLVVAIRMLTGGRRSRF